MKDIALQTHQSLREHIAWKVVDLLQPLYLRIRYKKKPWTVHQDNLAQYPEGSLGKDIYTFLDHTKLRLIPKVESHDVFHVLLGFETSIKEESCLQFTLFGNGKRSMPMLACTAVSLLLWPEHWGDFYRSYKMGQNAVRFHDLEFEKLLKMPTFRVRECLLQKAKPYILS